MSLTSSEADGSTLDTVQLIGRILGPVLAVLIIAFADLGGPVVTRTAAVAVLMAVWWITEALPLAVTSLVPLVAFPLLGVASGKTVAGTYMNWIVFLFIGGFMIALAMEKWNLHRRIALHILVRSGSSPFGVMAGFMVGTAFISMWISNTAATMMMIPIGMAILTKWEEMTATPQRAFGMALMLGIPYAASIGGIATLVGTPPNMSLVGVYDKTFPGRTAIDFGRFMLFAAPLAFLMLATAWGWLAWSMRRTSRSTGVALDRSVVRDELRAMGRITRPEVMVFAVAVGVAMAWTFRSSLPLPGFTIPGWSSLLSNPKDFDDGTVAMAFALLLFLIPSGRRRGERLLDASVFPQLPWGIVLLFGGGFALADSFESSGLSLWIGQQLAGLKGLPVPVIMLAVCFVITFLTEVTSNTASAQILLPVLAALAVELRIDPLLLMVPGAISCSCAFMLPVATPPNAIAFGTGRLAVGDMVKAGLVVNIAGVVLVTAAMLLWGKAVFGIE